MLQAPGSPGSGPSMPSLKRIDLPRMEFWDCGRMIWVFKRHGLGIGIKRVILFILEIILSDSWYKCMNYVGIRSGSVFGISLMNLHVFMFFCVEMICLWDGFLWCPNKCHVRLENRLRSTFKTWWAKLHWLLKQQIMRSNFPSILGSGFSGSMSKTGD